MKDSKMTPKYKNEKLFKAIQAKALNFSEVCKGAGMHPNTFRKMINGQGDRVHKSGIRKLCAFLNKTPFELGLGPDL